MVQKIAKLLFELAGWKFVGQPVPVKKAVVVVAYHTSNWDAFPCLVGNLAINAKASWIGKQSIFWWPLGRLLRAVGGIPVNRKSHADLVDQIVKQFNSREYCVLAIAPEGTRRRTSRWKTGFYYIALHAEVPIQMAALDYKHKHFVFSEPMNLTGDFKKDMFKIREFFRAFEPKHPELADKDFSIEP